MTRRLILTVLTLAACAYLYVTEPSAESQQCTEDMSCWDCETMGNGQCGPPSSLIPPTSIVGDPTEPVPFDDGDPAYPLTPEAPVAEPISGRPSFTG